MTQQSIRINKALARAGLASRRQAERMILAGQVRLNGEVVRELGVLVTPGTDRLEVDGKTVRIRLTQTREMWALYKPKGCISTLKDPQGRATIADYFPPGGNRLFPVGRLDYDAEGLILLTNDGELSHRIAHPSFGMEKIYLVKIKGLVNPENLRKLSRGPVLEGKKRQQVKVRVLHHRNDKTWLEVTLREGIQHHIKKMFAKIGHRVLKIKRYQIGPVELGDMKPGQCRKLGAEEIERLVSAGGKSGSTKKVTEKQKNNSQVGEAACDTQATQSPP